MKLVQSEALIIENENGNFYSLECLDSKANVAIFKNIKNDQYVVVSNPDITADKKIEWDFSYGYYIGIEAARESYILKTVSSEELSKLVEVEYIQEQLPDISNDQVNQIYVACNRAYCKDESGLSRYKIIESITECIKNNDITIGDINKASPWDILDSVITESNYALKKDNVEKCKDVLAYEMEI